MTVLTAQNYAELQFSKFVKNPIGSNVYNNVNCEKIPESAIFEIYQKIP